MRSQCKSSDAHQRRFHMRCLHTVWFALIAGYLSIASAATYTEPTRIPFDHAARMDLIENFESYDRPEQRRRAVLAHVAVVAGDGQGKAAVQTVEQRLQAVRDEYPDDAELMAARGALMTYKASIIENNTGETSFLLGKGNRLMDRAVVGSPKHLGARMQRGIATAHMPAFVGRAHVAVKDWRMVRDHLDAADDSEIAAFVAYHYGLALSKDGQRDPARSVWREAVAVGIAPWSSRAADRLE